MFKMSLVLVTALLLASCMPKKEVVAVYKGDPGTSCSVSNEYGESEMQLGARISCTDGSFSVIYNGAIGAQGIQGPQGDQGIQGPQGTAGRSCQAYRLPFASAVLLSCPGQFPVFISDGRDGDDGRDGASCSSVRQSGKVKITCGHTVTYVYDGEDGRDGQDGKDGKSCTVTSAPGGANVKCGNGSPVFIANGATGPAGSTGPQGQPGRDGLNGADGEDAVNPGMSCNVHNVASWDGSTSLPQLFASNPAKGSFVLANFSVPDSQSSLGFPGMPSALQAAVGLEGYALDCNGYLNVPTSGVYTFKLLSDDGSRLLINSAVVIENQGLHAPQTVTASVMLNRGPNHINVVFFQGPHTQIALELKWLGPNTVEAVVPATSLTH